MNTGTRRLLTAVLALAMAPAATAMELTFQQGTDGYEGTLIAGLNSHHPDHTGVGPRARCDAALIAYHTLIRFEGVAEATHAALAEGQRIAQATLTLHWHSTVGNRDWHITASLLRRPWWSDGRYGPTWLAYVKDLAWWDQGGAVDAEQDVFASPLVAELLSSNHPVAELDITAALTDPAFGATPGERLRNFEQHGLILRKREDYPYAQWPIRFWGDSADEQGKRPLLRIRLEPGATEDLGELPPALDMNEYVAQLEAEGGRGRSAFTVTPEMLEYARENPPLVEHPGDADWHLTRRRELIDLPVDSYIRHVLTALDHEVTDANIVRANLTVLNTGAAQWRAWQTWDVAIIAKRFWPIFFPSAHERIQQFFANWLRTAQVEFEPDKVQWFRSRATWSANEQLWNHPAMGQAVCILGGEVAGADHVVAEGTHHLRGFLRQAAHLGSIGEFVAPYYYAMTLSAFQSIADHADDPHTRLMGSLLEQHLMLDLIERYHPGTRQVISPFSRSHPAFVMGAYDGMKYVLHVLSEDGVLIPNEEVFPENSGPQGRHRLYGTTVPPARVALGRGWRPGIATHLTDRKPLPYEVRSFKRRANDPNQIATLTTYMDSHYGLASNCTLMRDSGQGFALVGYWQRNRKPMESLRDICSLYTHYIANERLPLQANRYWRDGELGGPDWGALRNDGSYHSVQYRNKIIELSGPWDRENGHLTSLAHKVFIGQLGGTGAVWIDDQRVGTLPAAARFGQTIFIEDDPVYVAIVPLEATDLGRADEVTLAEANSHLIVSAYNFQSETESHIEPERINAARSGFVIEMAGAHEFDTFDDFRRHMAGTRVTQSEADGVWNVAYESGNDTLEIALRVADKHTRRDSVVRRKVNGTSPELPDGILRDSPCIVQGTTGELEKGGARLLFEAGLPLWLLADPVEDAWEIVNPNPDEEPCDVRLETAHGTVAVENFGMGRILFRPEGDPAVTIDTVSPTTIHYPATVTGALLLNGQTVEPVPSEQDGRTVKAAVLKP